MPANIKQFYLTCPADVEVGIRQGWFGRSMAEDMANIRVLPNHIFKVVLVVQKAVLGVEPAEQHMGWLYQVGEGLPQHCPSAATVASTCCTVESTHAS